MQQTLAKIAREVDTDKSESPGYIQNYERYLGPLRSRPVRLLELGVYHGGSLLRWQKYFPQGFIVGLDQSPNPLQQMPERTRFYQGSQSDESLLDLIARECAPDGFDVVIDDAAHVGIIARDSFRNLFGKHLKPGGLYVIEDWGTGYWDSWTDGACYSAAVGHDAARRDGAGSVGSRVRRRLREAMAAWLQWRVDPNFAVHNFGMVGLVKELVDEVGWTDITHPERGNKQLTRRASTIREMVVSHGQVILVKA